MEADDELIAVTSMGDEQLLYDILTGVLNVARTLAFLGPSGTYTEEAALLYDGSASLLPYPNITAVGLAVVNGEADQGVVP